VSFHYVILFWTGLFSLSHLIVVKLQFVSEICYRSCERCNLRFIYISNQLVSALDVEYYFCIQHWLNCPAKPGGNAFIVFHRVPEIE